MTDFRQKHTLVSQVQEGWTLDALEAQADQEHGPFGSHLRRIVDLLTQNEGLRDAVQTVLRGRPCPTPQSFYHLSEGGVLVGNHREPRLRCHLYTRYLERYL